MIRPSTALCGAAVIVVGYVMFQVKYEVMQQEAQLQAIDRDIAQGRGQMRILNAEWNFLNQPTRLDELAQRYLDLVPIGTAQLGAIDTIPLRNPPPAGPAVAAAGTTVATLKQSAVP